MELKYDDIKRRYYVVSQYSEKHIPKSADFWWDGAQKYWYTYDADRAYKLVNYASDDVKKRLEEFYKTIEMSQAVESAVDFIRPKGLEYYPYQKAGIAFGIAKPNILLADAMRLGKTIQALGIINNVQTIRKILIICPATVKLNWRNEANKWLVTKRNIGVVTGDTFPDTDIVIINYDLVSRHKTIIDGIDWDLLILDEAHYCFPYDTEVYTDKGTKKIGDIVTKNLSLKVLSFNHNKNCLEYKDILTRFSNPLYEDLVSVKHKYGEFGCTSNHKIYSLTRQDYVEARKIKNRENLWFLPKDFYRRKAREKHSKILFSKMFREVDEFSTRSERKNTVGNFEAKNKLGVRNLQKAVFSKTSLFKGDLQKKILFKPLSWCVDDDVARTTRSFEKSYKKSGGSYYRKAKPKIIGKNEKKQPNVEPRISRKNAEENGRENLFKSRWERPAYGSSKTFSGKAKFNGKHRVYNSNVSSKRKISKSSSLLQSRYRNSRENVSSRDRWKKPRHKKVEISGQTERVYTKFSRVESCSIQEQGSIGKFRISGGENKFVYNIEIADNNNYFANGVLVSNCKNYKTKRTQNILGKLAPKTYEWEIKPIPAKKKIYMTGTPIVNRPKELWTLVNSLDSNTWKSFYYFSKRYCNGYTDQYGHHYDGASNLDELQTKLRASIMIRRTFEEVFPEMPLKQRQVIEIPADKTCLKALKKESQYTERLDSLKAAVELAKVSDDPTEYANAVKSLQDGVKLSFEEISAVRRETAIAKAPLVVDYISDIFDDNDPNYKLVVFAHHKEVVSIIRAEFPNAAVITGDTPVTKRQEEIERFQNDPTCNLFIGTIGAAGVGINLAVSSHILMIEEDWVPGNVSQAEDRVRHVTKMTPVLVQHLVLEGSIDATMAKTIIEKQEIIDKALDEDLETTRSQPIIPVPEPIKLDRKELEEEAVKITDAQLKAAHIAIRLLAGYCDGARELDGMGFNKLDADIGKKLGLLQQLTPKQGVLAMKIARKYKRQIPEDIYELLFGKETVVY
jgi:hypothetical protein